MRIKRGTVQRKNFSVVYNGTELKGYTAAEAEGILSAVAATISDSEGTEVTDTNTALQGNVTEHETND